MFTRHADILISEALTDTPVVLVNGPRQAGKSTSVKAYANLHDSRYVTLDSASVREAATTDATGFIATFDPSKTLVIDEVQRAPGLLLAIKEAVDSHRRPGRFLLTGSANVLTLPQVADSLAGRMQIISLWPLSMAEMAHDATHNRADWLFSGNLLQTQFKPLNDEPPGTRNALIAALCTGGFPEAVQRAGNARRRGAWFASYAQSMLQRDVRDLARVEQLTQTPQLLSLLAARSATLLNFAELSRSSGLPQTSLKRYFALLEMLFLLHRVPAWERNASKRLVKAPKVFLPDSGLMADLLGVSEVKLQDTPGLPGALLETFVCTELLKHLSFTAQRLTLWHWRTQTGSEVDFVLESPQGQITGIEVKASMSVSAQDFKGLRALRESEPQRFKRGIVLYSGQELLPFGEQLYAVPMHCWWRRIA